MINLNKKLKIIIFSFVAVILLLSITVYNLKFKAQEDGTVKTTVYFLNSSTNELQGETRYIKENSEDEMVKEVFNILFSGPLSKSLNSTFDKKVKVLGEVLVTGGNTDKMTLKVDFSKEYHQMNFSQEQFFRASLVYSMTELPFVDGVLINVDGKPLSRFDGNTVGLISRKNLETSPVISPEKTVMQEVTLYFYNKSEGHLVEEKRKIAVNPNYGIERYVLENLIKGPTAEGLVQTVPSETKILGEVKTEDEICYLNLSEDFNTKNNASEKAIRMNVYSIVNSLTEIENVKKVQFLIKGEKISDYKGFLDLSKPIERDESFLE